jgi:hypothetical protein
MLCDPLRRAAGRPVGLQHVIETTACMPANAESSAEIAKTKGFALAPACSSSGAN